MTRLGGNCIDHVSKVAETLVNRYALLFPLALDSGVCDALATSKVDQDKVALDMNRVTTLLIDDTDAKLVNAVAA